MRVLVIGGTQFIGWHIASALIRAGHSICVFHRGSTPLDGLDGASEILGEKEDLLSYRDRFRDFHPDAAAISHFLSKDWASSAVFNLGDPVALSEAQWIEHIAGIAGWTGKIVIVPDDQLQDPLKAPFNAAQNWTVDASRFRSERGFAEPFTLKESLEETITWLRSNPPSVPAERLERWEQQDRAEDQWLARN